MRLKLFFSKTSGKSTLVPACLLLLCCSLSARIPGHWSLDTLDSGTAPEASGRDFLAINLTNGPSVEFDPERHSNVLVLDAQNLQAGAIAANPFFNPPGNYTFAVWLYTTDLTKTRTILRNDNGRFQLQTTNGSEIRFSAEGEFITTPAEPNNQWHHVAGVRSESDLSLYVNGELVAQTPHSSPEIPPDGEFFVGTFTTASGFQGDYHDGKLDDLIFMHRAADQEKIQRLMTYGPYNHWDFNETTGTEVLPTSGLTDLSGTLLLNPQLTEGTPDGSGKALLLASESHQFMEIADTSLMEPSSGFSIALWINPAEWGENATLFRRGRDYPQISLHQSGTDLVFNIGGAPVTAPLPALDTWTHLVASFDTMEMRLFTNGILQANSDSFPEVPEANPYDSRFWVGASRPFSSDAHTYFSGKMDDLIWLDRAVSANEAATLAGLQGDTFSNTPPDVPAQSTFSTNPDSALPFRIPARDTDGDPLQITMLQSPDSGALSGEAPYFTYTPDPGFHGIDSFTFQTVDPWTGETSDPATVYLTVANLENQTLSFSQERVMSEDERLEIQLQAEDADEEPLAFFLWEEPEHGTLEIDFPHVSYLPDKDFSGTDSFSFRVNDSEVASVTIEVSPIPEIENLSARRSPETAEGNLTAITLSWDPFPGAAGYTIERSPGDRNWEAIETVDASTLEFYDPSPEPGIEYFYKVSAIDAGGSSFTEITAPGIFDVTDYGAMGNIGAGDPKNPTDSEMRAAHDDTEAFRAALQDASLFAQNLGGDAHHQAILFIPDGEYKLVLPALATGNLWKFESGAWVDKGAWFDGAQIESWHFGTGPPESATGGDNDTYYDMASGNLYQKSSGSWGDPIAHSNERDNAPPGIIFGRGDLHPNASPFSDTAETMPIAAGEGDYFLHPLLDNDHTLKFGPDQNGVSMIGESRESTILHHRMWGDFSPEAYDMVDRNTVLWSHVPDHRRGSIRPLRGNGVDYIGSVQFMSWMHFTFDGGAPPRNGNHEWLPYWGFLNEWDIEHKAILGQGESMYMLFDNLHLKDWRGEHLWRGGNQDAVVTIRNSIFEGSNASVISQAGILLVENCEMFDIYNGFECQFEDNPNHFFTIRNVNIEFNRNYVGDFPIGAHAFVFFADETTQPSLIENCTVDATHGVDTGRSFLWTEFLNNVTVRNNEFINTRDFFFDSGVSLEEPRIHSNLDLIDNIWRFDDGIHRDEIIFGWRVDAGINRFEGNSLLLENGSTADVFLYTKNLSGTEALLVNRNTVPDGVALYMRQNTAFDHPIVGMDNVTGGLTGFSGARTYLTVNGAVQDIRVDGLEALITATGEGALLTIEDPAKYPEQQQLKIVNEGEIPFDLNIKDGQITINSEGFVIVQRDQNDWELVEEAIPPGITLQPDNTVLQEGETLILDFEHTGSAPVSYQWFFNGDPIPGQNARTLTLPETVFANAGDYQCEVENSFGTTTTEVAVVQIVTSIDPTLNVTNAYPFEDDLLDSVGSSDLTPQNSVSFTPDGRIGKAVLIEGSGNEALTNGPSFSLDSDWSFSFWIKLETTGSFTNLWMENQDILRWRPDQDTVNWRVRNTPIASSSIPQDTSWHHIALVWDADGEHRFYMDGILAGSNPLVESSILTLKFVPGAGSVFLDELLFFQGHVLSPEEVTALAFPD